MGGIDKEKPAGEVYIKLRQIIDAWHRREDGDMYIAGHIDTEAKERLALELELLFSSQSETKEIVKDNLEKPKRGRPPHVNR